MRHERIPSGDEEHVPAGEGASREAGPPREGETFPAGVECDEGERPGDELEEGQPGMSEDPPRTD